jgi:BlaI family penicillinase repressor
VRTLLDRLVGKGALKVLSDGKRRFVPGVSQEVCLRSESRSFMERVFGGRPASMLLHVIKNAKLTKAEIDQLKKILSEKKK